MTPIHHDGQISLRKEWTGKLKDRNPNYCPRKVGGSSIGVKDVGEGLQCYSRGRAQPCRAVNNRITGTLLASECQTILMHPTRAFTASRILTAGLVFKRLSDGKVRFGISVRTRTGPAEECDSSNYYHVGTYAKKCHLFSVASSPQPHIVAT